MQPEAEVHTVDLGPPRDQGSRPTCLSFAISDVHRFRLALGEHLSPESLHRAAASCGATSIEQAIGSSAALKALNIIGQTTEKNWPYNSAICLVADAVFHKRAGLLVAFNEKAIAAELINKNPIVIILDIGEEFFACVGGAPLEAQDICAVEACHAVVLTGVQTMRGERYFRLRNSWGVNWGHQGQAWVSTSYLMARSPFVLRID